MSECECECECVRACACVCECVGVSVVPSSSVPDKFNFVKHLFVLPCVIYKVGRDVPSAMRVTQEVIPSKKVIDKERESERE